MTHSHLFCVECIIYFFSFSLCLSLFNLWSFLTSSLLFFSLLVTVNLVFSTFILLFIFVYLIHTPYSVFSDSYTTVLSKVKREVPCENLIYYQCFTPDNFYHLHLPFVQRKHINSPI